MAKKKTTSGSGESEFVLRAMDILLDAKHRKLETIEPKEIEKIVEDLAVLKDEAAAAEILLENQRQDYAKVMAEVEKYLSSLAMMAPEIPADIRLAIENIERKQREAARKALEAEKEAGPEPE